MEKERALEYLIVLGYDREKAEKMLSNSTASSAIIKKLELLEAKQKKLFNKNIDPLEYMKHRSRKRK